MELAPWQETLSTGLARLAVVRQRRSRSAVKDTDELGGNGV
jgi:hypothetical protein